MKDFKTILLMRDNQSDDGTIPSKGGSYASSPDIITHEQIANPQAFLTETYYSDVNQPLRTGSMTNYIYARAKNLDSIPHQGFIRVYYCTSSLFMSPSKWKNNKVRTYDGADYASTQKMDPGEVGVITDPFIFNAQVGQYYCHVGYVGTNKTAPVFPDDFTTYDQFVCWIKTNPHIALRNFSIEKTPESAQARFYELSNPSQTENRLGALLITMEAGFPQGTVVEIDCAPMGIRRQRFTVTSENDISTFTTSGIIPAGFEGYVSSEVFMPAGKDYPAGKEVLVEAYVAYNKESVAAKFAVNLAFRPNLRAYNSGRLLPIGACSTIYIPEV